MHSFAFIPLIALLLFLLEFCTLAAAKKNPLVSSFLFMLVFLIAWSGGSLLMRVQFLGLIAPWFHLSLIGLWVAAIALDELLARFAGTRMSLPEKAFGALLAVVLAANVATDWFLAPPQLVEGANGYSLFIYGSFTPGTYILYGMFAVFSVVVLARVVGCVRCRALSRSQAMPISFGSVCVIAGQLLILLPPFEGIPLDLVMGIVFAVCCFVSLYNKHLFSLTLAFSGSTYAVLTAGVMMLICIQFVNPLNSALMTLPNPVGSNSVCVIAMLSTVLAFALYRLVRWLSNAFFLKDHTSRSEGLRAYQEEVSKTLSVADIGEQYCEQICRDLRNVRTVRLCLRDANGDMPIVASSIPFEAGSALFQAGSSVVEWLERHVDVLTLSEFMRSVEARAMWEDERQQLRLLDIFCIVPLMANEELVGASVVTTKDPAATLSITEMDHLLSLSAVTAIGVKNSLLYEQAALEARTDDLTGLLNRKYFHQELERISAEDPNRVLSLILLNIDDFKLYNQLYGEAESDVALQRVAGVIRTTIGEGNLAARLGGKEFAVLMPDQGVNEAKRLAENVSSQIYRLNRDAGEQALEVLTCSIGICGMPFDAHNTKQLLDNANMAVFHVKQHGKNAIMVYSTGLVDKQAAREKVDHSHIYSSYADTIYALTAAIDAKDHYTFTHSNNVAYYASELASACGLNAETVEIVREAALLHDIGKIGIPEDILKKPGRLSADEYEIIKKHPQNAVAIIRHLPSLDYVIPAVVAHHERWDGKGYPRRLAGEDIPLTARILCVADCFDAITTKRCYQEPKDVERALRIMEDCAGTQFDPHIVGVFVEEFRAGRIVLQAERAEVSSAN